MRPAMRRKAVLPVLPLLLASCLSGAVRWPRWASDLSTRLECGMKIDEIKGLTDKEIRPFGSGAHPWVGDYRVHGGRSDLSLMFDESERLQSIALSQVDGWRIMSVRLSPRRDLCSGQLSFLLRYQRTAAVAQALDGADVFLDGLKLDPDAWRATFLEVPVGVHELLFVKNGLGISKRVDLKPDDRGEQPLELTEQELRPLVVPGADSSGQPK